MMVRPIAFAMSRREPNLHNKLLNRLLNHSVGRHHPRQPSVIYHDRSRIFEGAYMFPPPAQPIPAPPSREVDLGSRSWHVTRPWLDGPHSYPRDASAAEPLEKIASPLLAAP